MGQIVEVKRSKEAPTVITDRYEPSDMPSLGSGRGFCGDRWEGHETYQIISDQVLPSMITRLPEILVKEIIS